MRNRKCVTFTFLNGQLRINNNYFSLRHSNVSEIPDAIYFFLHIFFSLYIYLPVCIMHVQMSEPLWEMEDQKRT